MADRPKSAGTTGLMTTVTGTGTNMTRNTVGAVGAGGGAGMAPMAGGAGGAAAASAAGGATNTLSYGSLKNRFLSGSKTKSSKLFSLS